MDKVLKFFQIVNQIVWIGVGLATIYSIYYFIVHNPLEGLIKGLNPLSSIGQPSGQQPNSLESNPQAQKLIQQYLQNQGK